MAIDCMNMNTAHVCQLDGCTCGFTNGKCEELTCEDYKGLDYSEGFDITSSSGDGQLILDNISHTEVNGISKIYVENAKFIGIKFKYFNVKCELYINLQGNVIKDVTLNSDSICRPLSLGNDNSLKDLAEHWLNKTIIDI